MTGTLIVFFSLFFGSFLLIGLLGVLGIEQHPPWDQGLELLRQGYQQMPYYVNHAWFERFEPHVRALPHPPDT